MFFDGWSELGRVLLVGTTAYAWLVVVLRASGKRTLTKLNAFDLVVTVALGSTLATVLLSKSVALLEGFLALLLLVLLQLAITWLSVRSRRVRRLVKAEPSLLVRDGVFLDRNLATARITRAEVLQAMRQSGMLDTHAAAAVVLETDGSLSVLPRPQGAQPLETTLANVLSEAPDGAR